MYNVLRNFPPVGSDLTYQKKYIKHLALFFFGELCYNQKAERLFI